MGKNTAEAPTIFGKPMRFRVIRGCGPQWSLRGSVIEQYPPSKTYYWYVTPKRGALPVAGNCKSPQTASRQIERAITRIREAAARLGT